MPQHPLEWRKQKAKREGSALMLKRTDLGEAIQVSAHAAKKSRYNAQQAVVIEERRVGPRSPPDRGASRRRAESAAPSSEAHRRPRTTVNGRKKAPSQMNVKREGGPKNKSPLHGG